ncbi:sensor histidine kinase [Nocardia rhizosphaerae]|uniref:histidine kinase n=1 Tax=Nocardia rhizosphaerae TaxID=1691571 RepID=A0ABV8KYI5_9NOCA
MRSQSRQAGLIRPRTIAGRLARILAISLVLVLALLGLAAAPQLSAFARSGDTVDAVAVALAAQDLVHEVQRERGLSNGLLGGDPRLEQPVADQRAATDVALRAVSGVVAADPPGAAELRSALGQLSGLPAVRAQVDTRTLSRQAVFQFYSDAIDAVNRLTLGLDQARDPEVRHGLQALYALGDAKEHTGRERGFLNGVFAAGEFAPGEYVQFLDIRAAKHAALVQFGRDATPGQQNRLDAVLSGASAAGAAEAENIAIASMAGPLIQPVDPALWWAGMTEVIDAERAVQQAVGDDIRARAADLRRTAALVLAAFALAALLAIAAEIALVFASIRAIVRPLAGLAAEADDVASRRLPEVIAAWRGAADTTPAPPAPVRTPPGASTEIGAVAAALDRVQTTAFELASEQALVRRNTTESMANLARRNQNLVRRQLGLISEFERTELDPKALSNLFELDHLATRMRRNAESLLVLVGEASPRRWAEPIALTDVIRAGLSEVDDYRRVALRRVDDVAITGAVVSELAHVLAELIENGLAFSPPDLEVEIYGRKVAGGYLLAVVDHGVGMPADQLDEANARLRGEQDFIVAATRYLGHYVVGRLAGRLGITVELNTSPVSGIVARLLLPPGLLAAEHTPRSADSRGERGRRADSLESDAGHGPEAGSREPGGRGGGPAERDRGTNAAESAGARDRGTGSPGPVGAYGRRAGSAGDRVHAAPISADMTVDGRAAEPARPEVSRHGLAVDASAPEPTTGANESAYTQFLSSAHPVAAADPATVAGAPDIVGAHGTRHLPAGDGLVDGAATGTTQPGNGAPRSGSHAGDRAGSPQARTRSEQPATNPRGSASEHARNGGPRSERPGPATGDQVRNGAQARELPGLAAIEHVRTSVPGGEPGPAAVERTRNGLVKRSKRTRVTGAPDRPRPVLRQDRPPLVDRTPDQTRSMLAAFRTGHERGGDAAPPEPTPPTDRNRPQEPR